MEAVTEWTYKGVPENPSGWLFKVAKNKALNIVNRDKYKRRYASDIAHYLKSEWTADPALDLFFSEHEILDDQLRMMFTCCHPSISSDSQVALTLKTLCGFSIPEIAHAFLTSEDTINKRLVRARQKIRDANISFEVPQGIELEKRASTVLEAIYLLFNEGYKASGGNDLVRYELCEEAIRLAEIILSHPVIHHKESIYACLALMLLNASRFRARQDDKGNILTMAEQDRSLWDRSLVEKGFYCLEKATTGNTISVYHILAAISGYHCSAPDFESTDWKSILSLYDKLLQIDDSPLVLLNRAIAVSKVVGVAEAIKELEQIENDPAIASYHLFYSTKAELHIQANQFAKANDNLKKAIYFSRLEAEKKLLGKKLEACNEKII